MTKAYDFVACHDQFCCLDMAVQLFQEFRTRIQGLVKDSMYISECQFNDYVFQIGPLFLYWFSGVVPFNM